MLKTILNTFKKAVCFFNNETFGILVVISIFLIIRNIEVCYDVKNFKYVYILLLFITGIIIYLFYRYVLKDGYYQILFSVSFFIMLGLLYCYDSMHTDYLYRWFVDNFIEINKSINLGEATYFNQYMPYLIILIPCTIPFLILLHDYGHGYIAIAVILIPSLVLWYTGYDKGLKIYYYICPFLCWAICGISMLKKSSVHFVSRRFKITINRVSIVYQVMVLSIIIAFASTALVKLFGIKNVFQIADQVMKSYMKTQQQNRSSMYDIIQSRYGGDNDKLGGPISINYDVVYKIKSEENLYLRGIVKDYYDGFRWKKNEFEYVKKNRQPLLYESPIFYQYMLSLSGINAAKEDRLDKRSITVFPVKLMTTTYFAPCFTYEIIPQSGSVAYDYTHTLMRIGSGPIKKPYTVNYYKSASGIEVFSTIKDSKFGISYKTGKGMNPDDSSFYKKNVEEVYGPYLQLPDNIPERIYNLVDEITQNCRDSNEKVKKIYEYLYKNFKYSLNVSEVPENNEFVDYFIFTEKKGYCTYFSTAAAVFCRIAGIPARYVEGFRMYEKKDDKGFSLISNDMAHAWVEILLVPGQDLWTILDCVPEYQSVSGLPINNEIPVFEIPTATPTYENVETLPDKGETALVKIIQWDGYTIASVSFLFLCSIFFLSCIVLFTIRKNSTMCSDSIIPLYDYSRRRLESIGFDYHPGKDELKWLDGITDSNLKLQMRQIIDAAYKEYYGGMKVEFDRNAFYKYLEHYIKHKQNVISYIVLKYIFYLKK